VGPIKANSKPVTPTTATAAFNHFEILAMTTPRTEKGLADPGGGLRIL
jgi:hypothetical protein